MSDEGKVVGGTPGAGAASTAPAGARPRSETTTLVFAVAVAVALGVACGVWINSLLASSAARAARTRPAPEVLPPAGETKTLQAPAETASAAAAVEEPAASVVEGRVSKPAATPVPREESRQAKEGAHPAATQEVEKRAAPEREDRRETPCALYSSASSLTMHSGGAAFLVVGGPGQAPVTVSTPSWADIAVLYEGPAAGRSGWVRYTVKSVSKRPGLYTVRFATSCGSQTIPVTVK